MHSCLKMDDTILTPRVVREPLTMEGWLKKEHLNWESKCACHHLDLQVKHVHYSMKRWWECHSHCRCHEWLHSALQFTLLFLGWLSLICLLAFPFLYLPFVAVAFKSDPSCHNDGIQHLKHVIHHGLGYHICLCCDLPHYAQHLWIYWMHCFADLSLPWVENSLHQHMKTTIWQAHGSPKDIPALWQSANIKCSLKLIICDEFQGNHLTKNRIKLTQVCWHGYMCLCHAQIHKLF